ncbi:hypothetical protein D3C87_2061130 [compost metagenome]
MQAAFGQQVVNVGDAAIERVFDRHDGEIGAAGLHGIDGLLKGDAADRLFAGEEIVGSGMAEGAGLALESDLLGHRGGP